MTIAIVGGGAVGTTAAYDLARAGEDVVLYERGRIGDDATGAIESGSTPRAAGVCYDAYADRRDARIGARSIERFRSFSDQGAFEFTDCPYLWLAAKGDHGREQAIWRAVQRMDDHDLDVTVLDSDELASRFPALTVEDVGVAAVTTGAGFTDPGRYPELLAELARDEGATIHEESPVRIDTNPLRLIEGDPGDRITDIGDGDATGGEAGTAEYDRIVLATGAYTKRLCSAAGVRIPLKPYRVQALTSSLEYDGPMVYDATAGIYCRPHESGLLAGDGTIPTETDPEDWRRDGDQAFVRTTRARLQERLAIGQGDLPVERAWAGICAATPDRNPLVGRVQEGLWLACGWQGHGFMRSPAIAERLAAQLRGEEDGISGFDPGRFDGNEEFEIVEGMAIEE